MSSSSPVSVGICPSYRTLEVGSVQFIFPFLSVKLKHFPVAEEPFTDTPGKKRTLAGMTACEIIIMLVYVVVSGQGWLYSMQESMVEGVKGLIKPIIQAAWQLQTFRDWARFRLSRA